MSKYSIGIDFGTLSGRAVIVNVKSGEELAHSEYEYPHAVIDRTLGGKTPLPPDFALQHPQDYLDALYHIVPDVLKKSGVSPKNIIGIGTDFTSATILPVKADGTPLCFLPEFAQAPHAYVKLWKHHAAQEQADKMTYIAKERGESWLSYYGGRISSEWEFPKLLEIIERAPNIYDAADYFVEAGDWIVWQLTDTLVKSSSHAGYKGLWNNIDGYPTTEYFESVHPRLKNVIEEKMPHPIKQCGSVAGGLSHKAAKRLGLLPNIPVAVGIIDAHACLPAAKIDSAGKMIMVMGTSAGHMILCDTKLPIKGICGVVKDGIIPNFFAYEAGQSCVGDHFAWFVDNCLPAAYYNEAAAENKNIHAFLREKAEKLRAGESGLLALDWWNGNRSVLIDSDLTGLLIGMTLQTKPEEIYRALIEAVAYGTRCIIETFKSGGAFIDELVLSGGIPQKDPLAMQIYSDVLNLPISIADSANGSVLGAAILAAAAVGRAAGGYDSISEAARVMGRVKDRVYTPNVEAVSVYNKLYSEYKRLHDYFGRGENDVMKRLKTLKANAGE